MVSFDTARVFWGAQVQTQPGPDCNLICPVLSPVVCQRVSGPTLLKLPFRSKIWYRVCKMWEEEQISPQIVFSICKSILTSCCVPLLHIPNASSGCCWLKILDLNAIFFLVRGDFLSHECLLACMALSWLRWVHNPAFPSTQAHKPEGIRWLSLQFCLLPWPCAFEPMSTWVCCVCLGICWVVYRRRPNPKAVLSLKEGAGFKILMQNEFLGLCPFDTHTHTQI